MAIDFVDRVWTSPRCWCVTDKPRRQRAWCSQCGLWWWRDNKEHVKPCACASFLNVEGIIQKSTVCVRRVRNCAKTILQGRGDVLHKTSHTLGGSTCMRGGNIADGGLSLSIRKQALFYTKITFRNIRSVSEDLRAQLSKTDPQMRPCVSDLSHDYWHGFLDLLDQVYFFKRMLSLNCIMNSVVYIILSHNY